MLKSARFIGMFSSLAIALSQAGAGTPPVESPQESVAGVHVVAASQMAPSDAQVLDSHRAAVRTAAKFHGYDLAAGTWIQTQVVCPFAPKYLIMHNVQLKQDGFISLFSSL